MKSIYDVIKGPLITEKSTIQKDSFKQYVFIVDKKANKIEIKQAVEKLFNVKVAKVRTINMKGKRKRFRMVMGKRPDWKKAIVTLKEGTIELFEGV